MRDESSKPRIIEFPKDRGCLLFMTVSELFRGFAEYYPLSEFQILVISKDIVTDQKQSKNNLVYYESKYDNVDFVPTLYPNAAVMQFAYNCGNKESFLRQYDAQLCSEDCMTDICCIVDMVMNDNVKCIILVTNLDMTVGYIPYLKEFMETRFGFLMYDLYDFNDPTMDVFDIGNREAIQKQLELEIQDLTGSTNIDAFMNWYTDSMLGKFRKLLEEKSIEQLVDVANSRGIYVNSRWDRERIITTIIDRFR